MKFGTLISQDRGNNLSISWSIKKNETFKLEYYCKENIKYVGTNINVISGVD